jgi:uncharacterized protein (TIGR03437 family)
MRLARHSSIREVGLTAILLLFISSLDAQNQTPPAKDLVWRGIGGTTYNAGLAGPATGPVTKAWYAARGLLLAQTASGRIFETQDFVHWRLNTSVPAPRPGAFVVSTPGPENGAQVQAVATRLYAAGKRFVYTSEDNGKTWLNLTAYDDRSIIGSGINSLAVSPANPLEIAVANQFGVWRSLDGGMSWAGLNQDLPNLASRKLIDRRTVVLADGLLARFNGGSWNLAGGSDPEGGVRIRFGSRTGANVTAAASGNSLAYAGTADGRLLVSADNGGSWRAATSAAGASVERIWVDTEHPEVALAAAGSRLFRTVNGGIFWDDVTGSLPEGRIHGIAADRSANVVYVATDRGAFSGDLPLNDAGPGASGWHSISRQLPAAVAWDIRLNADNTLTVLMDGYGVFETAAPHRTANVRLVNGADLSDRPAAPGSLVSVLGAKVIQAKTDGPPYPILAASDQNSQLQVPFETVPGTFQLALESVGERWTVPLTVKTAAPAIFVDSEGAPLILDAATGLVLDPSTPIYAGSTVQILATGLGKVVPDWPTGVPAPVDSPPAVAGTVTAFLDGTPIEVAKATLAPSYVGYYVVELQIPSIVNRGEAELRVVMNGQESNRVKLYLEPDLPSAGLR